MKTIISRIIRGAGTLPPLWRPSRYIHVNPTDSFRCVSWGRWGVYGSFKGACLMAIVFVPMWLVGCYEAAAQHDREYGHKDIK